MFANSEAPSARGGSDEILSAIALLQSRHYVVLAPAVNDEQSERLCRLQLGYDLRLLSFDGAQVDLSLSHVRIVQLLLAAAGGWCTRDSLSFAIWGDSKFRGNALSVHMHYVQRRLQRLTGLERPLIASRLSGFRLAPELFT